MSGYLIISCLSSIIRKIRNHCKIITKNDIVDNYYNFQLFHLKEFKKAINNELKRYIKSGHRFPIYVNYEKVLSEDLLDVMRYYVKNTLKFEDFELQQRDEWVVCQLTLKG